jgi:hypothetical protein
MLWGVVSIVYENDASFSTVDSVSSNTFQGLCLGLSYGLIDSLTVFVTGLMLSEVLHLPFTFPKCHPISRPASTYFRLPNVPPPEFILSFLGLIGCWLSARVLHFPAGCFPFSRGGHFPFPFSQFGNTNMKMLSIGAHNEKYL